MLHVYAENMCVLLHKHVCSQNEQQLITKHMSTLYVATQNIACINFPGQSCVTVITVKKEQLAILVNWWFFDGNEVIVKVYICLSCLPI